MDNKTMLKPPTHCELLKKHRLNNNSDKEYDKYRKTSRERGYDANWEKFRKSYLKTGRNSLCVMCGKIGYIVHHKQEILKGGSKYDEDNLMTVCYKCHNKIHHTNKDRRKVFENE